MLEDLAFRVMRLHGVGIALCAFALICLGALLAAAFAWKDGRIHRAEFFAYTAILTLLVKAAGFVWMAVVPAITGGYLWAVMAINAVSLVIIGFYYGQIAMCRARDGFRDARYALLGFIPVANLVLLFKPPRAAEAGAEQRHVPFLVSGRVGIATGCVVFVAAALLSVVWVRTMDQVNRQAQADAKVQEASLASMIRTRGLEATLSALVDQAHAPVKVDRITTLRKLDASGAELHRFFVVDIGTSRIPGDALARIERADCAYPPFQPLLSAGATIRDTYVKADGAEIGEVVVSSERCDL